LEEDPFTGSPSNGRREYPPALPPLQGAFSHEFIARCTLEVPRLCEILEKEIFETGH